MSCRALPQLSSVSYPPSAPRPACMARMAWPRSRVLEQASTMRRNHTSTAPAHASKYYFSFFLRRREFGQYRRAENRQHVRLIVSVEIHGVYRLRGNGGGDAGCGTRVGFRAWKGQGWDRERVGIARFASSLLYLRTSVLKTYWSRGMTSSSSKRRYRYSLISA